MIQKKKKITREHKSLGGNKLNLISLQNEKNRLSQPIPLSRPLYLDHDEIELVEEKNLTISPIRKTRKSFYIRTHGDEDEEDDDFDKTVVYNRWNTTINDLPLSTSRIEELEYYPVKTFINNTLKIIIWLFIALTIYYCINYKNEKKVQLLRNGKLFCDSEQSSTIENYLQTNYCVPCPEYGYCAKGKLILCSPEHQMNTISPVCIRNELIEGISVIKEMKPILSKIKGNFECNKIKSEFINVKNLKLLLNQTDVNFNKAIKIINEYPIEFDITLINNTKFTTNSPKFTFYCKSLVSFNNNKYNVMIFIFSILLLMIYI